MTTTRRHDEFQAWRRWIQTFVEGYLSTNRYPHHRHTLRLIRLHPYTHPPRPPTISSTVVATREHFVYFQGRHDYDFTRWERHFITTRRGIESKQRLRLTYHPDLPLVLVLRFPNAGWDFKFLLLYRRWTVVQIQDLVRVRHMHWRYFSRNPYLTPTIILHFIHFPWDWKTLATHPSLPPRRIANHPILCEKWQWDLVFNNPLISVDTWRRMVKDSTATFDEHIILHNHFQHSKAVRLWANLRILEFMCRVRDRRRLVQKLRLLRHIDGRCQSRDILHHIVSFLSHVS